MKIITPLIKDVILYFLSVLGLALGLTIYFDYEKWWGLIIIAFNIPGLLINLFKVIKLINGERIKNTHPRDYIIAIRYDGVIFRVDKGTQEPKLFVLQYGDRPCAFRSYYFDFHGHLRKEFWGLPILKNINSMKKVKIEILSTPIIYGNQKDEHLHMKQSVLFEMCYDILKFSTIKDLFQWKDEAKAHYGKYFVILVSETLTVRDKKNIDKVILNIDLSEMEA